MASFLDLLTGPQITEFIGGLQNNPAYQQAKLQLENQQPINTAAWNAYNQYLGNVPQQQVAGFDPTRMSGLQAQLAAAGGTGANLAATAAGTGIGAQGGLGTSQNVLGQIAQGGISPGFSSQVAQDYLSSVMPSLQSAQQSLANQANLAWNKNVGNIGGAGGGFMSSGREAALGQAAENAQTNLAAQQQQLAYNAALQAAQAGQAAGTQQYTGQQGAAGTLGQQALTGAGLTPTLQTAALQPGKVAEGVGGTLQEYQQNLANVAYQNALLNQQNPFRSLDYLQRGLGVLGSTTQASPYNPVTNLAALFPGISNLPNALGNALVGGVGNLISGIGNTAYFPPQPQTLTPEQLTQASATLDDILNQFNYSNPTYGSFGGDYPIGAI